jgi:flagellar hook-length control protein FliK
MAAEGVPLTAPGAGPVSRPAARPRAGGSQNPPDTLCGRPPTASSSGGADAGSTGASSPASRSAPASADESAASGGAVADHSDTADSKPSGKSRSADSGHALESSKPGSPTSSSVARRGRGAGGAAVAASAHAAAQTAAATADFSAALAQSLAASPAGAAGAAAAAGATASAAGTTNSPGEATHPDRAGNSSEPAARHSTADPVSTALALLEQALAGALAGIPFAPATASTTPASTQDLGRSASADKSTAAALDALLPQTTLADLKPGASNATPTAGSAAPAGPAAPAGAASSAAATLTAAAQLPSGPHVGLQPGAANSSMMALASPVGTSAWTDELGARVTWMAHQGIESASLRLSPEHLGPLQVSISVHDGRASVWFGARVGLRSSNRFRSFVSSSPVRDSCSPMPVSHGSRPAARSGSRPLVPRCRLPRWRPSTPMPPRAALPAWAAWASSTPTPEYSAPPRPRPRSAVADTLPRVVPNRSRRFSQ